MKALKKSHRLVILILACGLPALLFAQESAQSGAFPDSRQGRTIGAPQVLEIPPQEIPPAVVGLPQQEIPPPPSNNTLGATDPSFNNENNRVPPDLPPVLVQQNRRTYLGVLYATAEEGPVGVKVLSVVKGSPAAKAGFQGADTPPSGGSTLFKAAIVVLAMSPAGPFAIPLAIAHDMYTNRQPPGDLIVAVDNRPVRDAQEFSDRLRAYQPGDTVVFSVMRGGKPIQVSVLLEEEPL